MNLERDGRTAPVSTKQQAVSSEEKLFRASWCALCFLCSNSCLALQRLVLLPVEEQLNHVGQLKGTEILTL